MKTNGFENNDRKLNFLSRNLYHCKIQECLKIQMYYLGVKVLEVANKQDRYVDAEYMKFSNSSFIIVYLGYPLRIAFA